MRRILLNRLLISSLAVHRHAKIAVRFGELRIKANRLAELLHGLIVISPGQQNCSKTIVGLDKLRIEVNRPAILRGGLIVVLLGFKRETEIAVGAGVGGAVFHSVPPNGQG